MGDEEDAWIAWAWDRAEIKRLGYTPPDYRRLWLRRILWNLRARAR